MPHPDARLQAFVQFFRHIGRLKRLQRQGWVDRGVPDPESVSDHSFRLALMTLLIAGGDASVDTDRALRLALVHDLPEALAGDVTPFDDRLREAGVDREALFHDMPAYSDAADQAKHEAERDALSEMTAELPDDVRHMLVAAWEEYEAGESREAQLVRQLDKLETWLQALEYRQEQPDLIIESFRRGTARDIRDSDLTRMLDAITSYFGDPDDGG